MAKVRIAGKTLDLPDEIARSNKSLIEALAPFYSDIGKMEIKRDAAKGLISLTPKPTPKPIVVKPVDPWAERQRKEKERIAAILKWLLPACYEAARLLVEKVEQLNQKVTETLATEAMYCALAFAEDCSYGDATEIAKRRGWKNSASAVIEVELEKLSFAQLAAYSVELRFWSHFYNYKAELQKKSIALLKEYGINFDAIATQFKLEVASLENGQPIAVNPKLFTEIEDSYSADLIDTAGSKEKSKVRKPFVYCGRGMITVSKASGGGLERGCDTYQVIPETDFKGKAFNYNSRPNKAQEAARHALREPGAQLREALPDRFR